MNMMAPLPNTHNLENTRDLIKKLENTPILPQFALASLDITNLYTNIPVKETREIIANALRKNLVDPPAERVLLSCYDTVTKQNCFSNKYKILIHQDGLAMDAPTSGIIAEIFLQNLEDIHLSYLSNKHKITKYFRYVDDIPIIYDCSHTDINSIQNDFNPIHPNMKFTAETESNNNLIFLDVTIHRTPTDWKISIHRKPPSPTQLSRTPQTTQPSTNTQP
jgi:hypothetical protein